MNSQQQPQQENTGVYVLVPEELIDFAADLIEENAEALRSCHSNDGIWLSMDEADRRAMAQYIDEKKLVKRLRARK